MGTKYFLLALLLFVCTRMFSQNDALRLNVNLYPVQMLTLEARKRVDENIDMMRADRSQLIVTSPSGFQIDASEGQVYRDTAGNQKGARSSIKALCNRVHHLFEAARGTVGKIYSIDKNLEKIIQEIGCSETENPDHLVLTLISQ